jgi:hypothetical protein
MAIAEREITELRLVPIPLIVSRECVRCPEVLRVKVAEDEDDLDALAGEMLLREWAVIGGELFCSGCIRTMEDDDLYG